LRLKKIKTIGDPYMVAGGLPKQQPDHAVAVAEMALGMIDEVRRIGTQSTKTWRLASAFIREMW